MEVGGVTRGTALQAPRGLSLAESDQVVFALIEKSPPEEVERSLAKFAVQLEVFPEFTVGNHIACAQPETPGNSWYRMIGKKMWDKYRCSDFDQAEVEITAVCLDVDSVIWGEYGTTTS